MSRVNKTKAMTPEEKKAERVAFDDAHTRGAKYVIAKDYANQPPTVLTTIGFAYADGFIDGIKCGQEGRWEPIETAPKDGHNVLLYCPAFGVDVGSYDTMTKFWRYNWKDYEDVQPTLWQPLPPLPLPPSPINTHEPK